MSGQSFPQDVVAGTQLVTPSIHSPDYVQGTSGWTVNLDGSAEFNNLTIRGTFKGSDFIINGSGAFFYSPSEGLGNLVVSIAPTAGTDSFGNSYPQGIGILTSTGDWLTLSQSGDASGSIVTGGGGFMTIGSGFHVNTATDAFMFLLSTENTALSHATVVTGSGASDGTGYLVSQGPVSVGATTWTPVADSSHINGCTLYYDGTSLKAVGLSGTPVTIATT